MRKRVIPNGVRLDSSRNMDSPELEAYSSEFPAAKKRCEVRGMRC